MLLAQLLLGLTSISVSLRHLDGGEMVRFMTWAQGVLTLRPDVAAVLLGANLIFKLHIVLGMTIFLVLPFTRLVHIWSAPVWYLGRRGYQIVRARDGSAGRPARPDRGDGRSRRMARSGSATMNVLGPRRRCHDTAADFGQWGRDLARGDRAGSPEPSRATAPVRRSAGRAKPW